MSFLIRNYLKKDFEDVSRIMLDSFGYEKLNITDKNAKEFVCVLEDKVVGYFYIYLKVDIIKDILIGDIEYVCVDINNRGKGIGNKMIDFAVDYAKKNNISRLELTSSNRRIAAHKLYIKKGFKKRDTSVFRLEIE